MIRRALAVALFGLSVSAAAASLSLDKGPVVLGKVESVGVTLRVDEAPGDEVRPLRISASVGSFSPLQRLRQGVYRTVYVPPATRFPQVALVGVWRETGPDAPIDFLKIPLYGQTKIEVPAPKGAQVVVTVALDASAPVIADKSGQAVVSLAVPPGIQDAEIKITRGTTSSQHKVPIKVPAYNRLSAGLVPHALVADGSSFARLHVFYDLGGADVPADAISVRASRGAVLFEQASRGRYVYRYQPQPGTSGEVSFEVSVAADPAAKAGAQLTLGLPRPARLVIQPPSRALAADGKSAEVLRVLAFDETGLGIPVDDLELIANGAKLPAPIAASNGVHELQFVAPAAYPSGGLIQFIARARGAHGPVTGTANYQLKPPPAPKEVHARFEPSLVPTDGRTSSTVLLDVRDAAGLPLEGAQLALVASHGRLGALEERGKGRYAVTYVAAADTPVGDPVLRLVDVSGGFEQSLRIPVREDPRRLLIGVRAGFTHSLGSLSGPRAGLELWVPLRAGSSQLAVGLAAMGGRAQLQISDGTLSTRSEALFLPASLRVGYELFATRHLSMMIGASASFVAARFTTSLTGATANGFGFGGGGFAAVSWALGPGQLFGEVGYSYAPVNRDDFVLEAGGVGVEAGYRVGIF